MRIRCKNILGLALLGLIVHGNVMAEEQTKTSAAAKPAQLPTQPPTQPHIIGAPKLIIGDVKQNQTYYEQMFGLKEVSHYRSEGVYDEPIMGYEDGARLALFSPKAEAQLKKPRAPVAFIFTPDLDGTVKRLEEAKYPVLRLPVSPPNNFQIAIARDPSDNAIELFARPGKWEVGGSKLIVDDRQKAEDFFIKIFNAKSDQRYQTAAYDEVIMSFGAGPFLALFQPKNEAPLPKSKFAVVAIYTTEFDAVLARIKEAGLGYRDVKTASPTSRIIVAQDPAGNAIEIISGAPTAPPLPNKK